MSKGFKVWIDYSKFRTVMKSTEMMNACKAAADEVASKDSNFRASGYYGKNRSGAMVWDNSSELSNKLLKAVR